VCGSEAWCQGFSEPDSGSDLASLRTRATEDGDQFVVNGQKVWSSGGHLGDWCLLLARTGEQAARHRSLSMFWVDMRAPGVTTRPTACASGRNELAEIFFDDVVVPRDHVVGAVDDGWAVAMYTLQFERGNYAWQRQAWMAARLTDALTHGRSAEAIVASKVGETYLTWLGLRARSRATLLQLADGLDLGASTSIDKVLMSTAEQAVLDTARLMSWPACETGDDDVSASWRRDWWYSRMASVYGGAVEVQRDIIADTVARLPRRH